jgi:hypothetical protein
VLLADGERNAGEPSNHYLSSGEADTAQKLLETRVGAQLIEGRAQQDRRQLSQGFSEKRSKIGNIEN